MIKAGQRWRYTTLVNNVQYIIEVESILAVDYYKCIYLWSSDRTFSRIGDWGIFSNLEEVSSNSRVSFEFLPGQEKPV